MSLVKLISENPVRVLENVPLHLVLQFETKGLPVWRYDYITQHGDFEGDSDDGHGAKRALALGTVAGLRKHAWELAAGWAAKKSDEEVTVTLAWWQQVGDDKKVVHTYAYPKAVLNASSPAWIRRGGVYFLAVAALDD